MLEEVRKIINENYNEENAQKMASYMKNNFKFAGIPAPDRKKLFAPLIKKYAKEPLN
mgnify:FL=1